MQVYSIYSKMLYKEYIKLSKLSVHKIGNKLCQEGVEFSKQEIAVEPDLSEMLKTYFLLPFKKEEFFHFFHISDVILNEVYSYASHIFDDIDTFHEYSKNLARFLYEQSWHPNIKCGELYVAYFKDCIVDGKTIDAIGIFKSENKDTFLRINSNDGEFSIESQLGVNLNKLDKGCLIFNTNKDEGYDVLVVDNTNRGEAKYWIDDFLQIKRKNDDYAQTQNAVALCRQFISKLPENVAKADKAAMMNRVAEGVKQEHVDINDLAINAFGSRLFVDSFMDFIEAYKTTHDVEIEQSFKGRPEAVSRRVVRTITTIKLDDNFDINIHGNNDLIEYGYDEFKGMRFYKLYFEEER